MQHLIWLSAKPQKPPCFKKSEGVHSRYVVSSSYNTGPLAWVGHCSKSVLDTALSRRKENFLTVESTVFKLTLPKVTSETAAAQPELGLTSLDWPGNGSWGGRRGRIT